MDSLLRTGRRGKKAEHKDGNKRIWKGGSIYGEMEIWSPSSQVHPLAEQTLKENGCFTTCFPLLCVILMELHASFNCLF